MSPRTLRRHLLPVAVALVVIAGATATHLVLADRDDAHRHYLAGSGWPVHGQASYQLDAEPARSSSAQRPVPIASLAKVMTAYLVLKAYPLTSGYDGFTLGITQADAEDTARRIGLDESVVRVRTGERLTERQALQALLLPSANNIAVVLARIISGSVSAFTALMNDMAHSLRMWHTAYTDPSGFDPDTRSTAADQLLLARASMALPAFAALVGERSARLPVAGTVHNTDGLLGTDGFVGIKTGSTDAAGGCFMFLSLRRVDGRQVPLYGVVLGQHGHNLVTAGLTAARQLADQVASPV
ncbi:hypothetical protein [Jatrophihabitans sp.]|uniref:D-alanyl-D-alanine carboxypeptidase family protein n=1 Tax=Jatrophihabitans sp. TaxID=1932789 RepID=UPI0030C7427D|nr:peptidase D-alanyl-D-alanine carboxypeptidase 1 [Jatrophihabitans sp.]